MSEQNEEEISERERILHCYRVGRSELEKDEIKDWEDPEFSIYQETDRYGFIHDNKLPDKMPEYERKLKEKENGRLAKWLKMIRAWDQYYPHDEKLRKRVYKGIPDAVRGKVWPKLLNIEQVKQEQEGVYERMLEFGMESSTDVRQIDLDVNRTYRNHRIFRERYNIRQQMLFKVLVAYSVYNTEVGYCQGMSQIAALLLMYMDEEDAFWCLSTLMSQKPYRMHGFFIPGFPKLLRFSKHHDMVVKKFLPRVAKHFGKFNIDSTLYTLKWFFQCFLDRVPFSLTLRIWDVFLLEGEDVLTGMSYTLLKLHKRSILSKGMEETIQLLQIDLEKDFGYHDDSAITELQKSMAELRKHRYLQPGDPPDDELPSKQFGERAFKSRSLLQDDRSSLAGSILLRPETYSIATSRTSEAESDAGSEKISLYDNVSLNESIEAAKAANSRSISRSQNNSTNSHHKPEPTTPTASHVQHHSSDSVITKEFTTTKSTFISVNSFTVENSSTSEHATVIETSTIRTTSPRTSTPIKIQTSANGSNGKIETLQQQPTSPSKIRIFVPYAEDSVKDPIKDSPVNSSPNSTAKGLPAVET